MKKLYNTLTLNKTFRSFILGISSIINFLTFMFLPKYVGIIQLDLFYEKNILPSALTLLLSPVLPAVAKNKKKLFPPFIIILFIYFIIFCRGNVYTGLGNLFWILFGFTNMCLFFEGFEKKFIRLTLIHSLSFLLFTFVFKSFIYGYFLSGLSSFILVNPRVFFSYFSFVSYSSIKNIYSYNSFLRPFFSISTFWLVLLLYIKFFDRENFVLFNYYQKISISIPVALFAYFSLDAYKIMKIELKKYLLVFISCIISVVICSLLVNKIIDEIELNIYLITLISILSILPLISFNIISDEKNYRFIFAVLFFSFFICLYFLGVSYLNLILIIEFCLLSIITSWLLIKNKLF